MRFVTLIFLSLAVLPGCGSSDSGGSGSSDEAPTIDELTADSGACGNGKCVVHVYATASIDPLDEERWSFGLAGIKSDTPPEKCAADKTITMSGGLFISEAFDSDSYYSFRVCIVNVETGKADKGKTVTIKTGSDLL
jgi:hypothetical protein